MSDLQAELDALQWSNYVSAVLFTAVIYDYFLLLSREVEYIWHRPWTWISMMFALIRLTGFAYMIASGLYNITWMTHTLHASGVIFLISSWSFTIFLSAGDFVMILRVYALWNRSKTILLILLLLYVPQVLFSITITAVFYSPRYLSASDVNIIGRSICIAQFDKAMYSTIQTVRLAGYFLRLAVSLALVTLAAIPALRQSTQKWQPNKYMHRIVQDGFLYFFLYLLFNLNGILQSLPTSITYYPQAILSIVGFSLIIPMTPRFIISMRELYEGDARGALKVDTAFGLSSQPAATGSTTLVMSQIVFAGDSARQGQVAEGDIETVPRDGNGIREELKGEAKDLAGAQTVDRAHQA